ncbi:DNA alkylation repair protein [Candidatus Uabimicrobium amorphum]|uniref:DNA alkylation repair protein n=1 Tax=Uabimicrobium amorphum TaxID=2596890 RepID=A0A5S9ITB4_UABAM|nr:DNA alkylation repair protein [Candidatus Uabimicrobium amorphum]BBM87171.1 DNA alkylation repair protein [Candidatus Uabimicrobium amorphum]
MKINEILPLLDGDSVKMGDIKKMAKQIKVDHDLASELWATKKYYPRLLAVLIMDKNRLDQDYLDKIVQDLKSHEKDESNYISEWLLGNQLVKNKKNKKLLESWQEHPEPILRRLFWYYQARLRWTGKIQENSSELMDYLEKNMEKADPLVQWTMNFCVGWIGVFEEQYRPRCIALGEKLGLYKDEHVSKGCTPSYLPAFIEVEVGKRNK